MKDRIIVFSGTAGARLAQETCKSLSIDPGKAVVGRFSDGEVRVQLMENVRGADVYIINPTHAPAENFVELALLSEAARGSSAGRITIVPTYMGYNRQDRKDRPRTAISAQIMMHFLAASGANRALLFDLHSEATAAHLRPLVVDHLYASAVSIPHLKTRLIKPFVVASPDKGGGPRAEAYARLLGEDDIVFFSKSRGSDGEVRGDDIRIIGDVRGKNVLLVDDIIDTGGTILADAQAAKDAGAEEIFVFATHAIFSKNAVERLDQGPITEIIVTDTVYHPSEDLHTTRVKLTVLSISALLSQAIRRIHEGESLSSLFLS